MSGSERTRIGGAWEAASWEGARRVEMRRWAELPLERIIAAQEEMAEIAEALARSPSPGRAEAEPPFRGDDS